MGLRETKNAVNSHYFKAEIFLIPCFYLTDDSTRLLPGIQQQVTLSLAATRCFKFWLNIKGIATTPTPALPLSVLLCPILFALIALYLSTCLLLCLYLFSRYLLPILPPNKFPYTRHGVISQGYALAWDPHIPSHHIMFHKTYCLDINNSIGLTRLAYASLVWIFIGQCVCGEYQITILLRALQELQL